jgi:hypothetical protein
MLAVVERVIAALPAMQRTVITLRDVSGWSSDEVRSVLDLTEADAGHSSPGSSEGEAGARGVSGRGATVSDHDLTCQELVELVTEYLEGGLTAAERERFEEHVVVCGGCANHLDQIRTTIELAGRVTVDDLLEETELQRNAGLPRGLRDARAGPRDPIRPRARVPRGSRG